MVSRPRRVVGFVAALCALAIPAFAQPRAETLDQLRMLVGAGERVTVTGTDGAQVSGRVVSLSRDEIAIALRGATRTFAERDVAAVVQRRPDSLANGAKIGFYAGAGLGVLSGMLIVGSDVRGTAMVVPSLVLVYGGLGSAIGVGFDAMIESDAVIFSRPPRTASKLSVTPISSAGRRGLSLTLRF